MPYSHILTGEKCSSGSNIEWYKFCGRCISSADLDVFQYDPNKGAIKNALGIDSNAVIIGTVMRNQKRKLFPELIQTFDRIVEQSIQNNYAI
jgi:hypothetical protein